ncbi:protein UBASH3A-like protein [Leptotrombidium deliense]|uniref:Protein UBASH3A-like protein n=1 Tax=Leptotrombidium deliense TaxID=299467 RepID=A0A443SFU9_9ACAR|nr:protein UBASH3A-like protein [Leptotrombidium deliense]
MLNRRELYIIRHGERCDQVFGTNKLNWIQACFDKDGNYNRFDLNLPKENEIPKRDDWRDFAKDAPLTRLGTFQASITGEELAESGVNFSYAYCSPSFRCVQTTHFVLKSMGIEQTVKINIEPGLFEWLGETYKTGAPNWMSPMQIKNYGFNVNIDYKPIMNVDKLLECFGESCVEWYQRSFKIVSSILSSLPSGDNFNEKGDNVLIVAHGGSMDPLTRMLTGKQPNKNGDLADLTPFCGVLRVKCNNDGKYGIVDPSIRGFKHLSNFVYQWQQLNEYIE